MLKFSVKHGGALDFTAGTSLHDELALMEEREGSFSQCPDDFEQFRDSLTTTDHNNGGLVCSDATDDD